MQSHLQQADVAQDIEHYLRQHQEKELLRFLTCGSVDDGKSTLIGRLLYDTKTLYEDQLAALRRDSLVHGTTGGDFDPALLTDGLKAEREQGITIDVAYRYFSTARRKFIIADTPGHEQYTRNMATGASHCDLAIILVDARHGVLNQTRRHSFIVSLLGIKHVVVAINKMDLCDWSEARFRAIQEDYLAFAARLETSDLVFIPMSALQGDNVVERSPHMPWYLGVPLLAQLETVTIAADRNLIDLRFPVQHVLRPSRDFRGYCGTIASGVLRRGEEVVVLPSGRRSRISSITTYDGPLEEAAATRAVTLTLEDEIDVSRGDMLARPGNVPRLADELEAIVVWMADEPLAPGREYLIKHTTRTVSARVRTLRYAIDVNTLTRRQADTLALNDIGRVALSLARPLMVDPYRNNRETGAFILIDRLTNNTVGAGMVLDRETEQHRIASSGAVLTWHEGQISREAREERLGQRGVVVWLTGLSGAGKSTIARALENHLFASGRLPFVLDGDNVRHGLCGDLGFSAADRRENIRRVAHVAELMQDAGLITLVAFISPYREDRDRARALVPPGCFFEVHVAADVDTCAARDPKGLYKKAQARELPDFTGVSAPYEAPLHPELVLDTARLAVEACVEQVMVLLRAAGVFEAPGQAVPGS